MIEVPLIGTDKVALVDDEDAWAIQYSWRLSEKGYVQRTARLHRDDHPGMQVDHRDRDPLNNQRSNLRIVTPAQNCWNRSERSDNTSGYTGVHWRAGARKWAARIGGTKGRVHLGLFDTVEEAAEAVARAREDRLCAP